MSLEKMERDAIMEPEVEAALEPEAVVEPVNPLLRIFPLEVWGLILDKIADAKDRVIVANSDPLFREYFQSKAKEEAWTLTLLGLVLPELYDYLPRNNLLTLRQVSKGWRNTVDTFLESGDMWKLMPYSDNEIEVARFKVDLRDYHPLEGQKRVRYDQFVNDLRALPQAKLVGGTVKVEQVGLGDFGPFFQEFGMQVYHLQLTTDDNSVMSVIMYARELLRSTPNLKTLSFDFTSSSCDIQRDNVVRFLEQNSLPDLPNLVSLRVFAGVYEQDGAVEFIRDMLVKYGSQLENLKLEVTDQSFFGQVWVRNPTDVEILVQSLRYLGAPTKLKKLELNFEVCLVELFRILETYKDSLTHLSLWYSHHDCRLRPLASSPFPSQINLPLLEELVLVGYKITQNTSFDFLANFPKLKRLELETKDFTHLEARVYRRVPAEYNADNDKLGITKNLMEDYKGHILRDDFKVLIYLSPFWEVLHLLESVIFWKDRNRVKILHIVSRKHYEYYQNKLAKMSFY